MSAHKALAPQVNALGSKVTFEKALSHFDHISRHFDPREAKVIAKLLPGDYYVTLGDEMVFTVLGSCVSACVRDRVLGIGGMNHFMLPEDASDSSRTWGTSASAATRYGNVAMEMLINDILKQGGRREQLEFKLVGGGRVLDAMTDIGARNIEFVRAYMKQEGFRVLGEDLGGEHPRKVMFHPQSGNARVKKLTRTKPAEIAERERRYSKRIENAPTSGDVELF